MKGSGRDNREMNTGRQPPSSCSVKVKFSPCVAAIEQKRFRRGIKKVRDGKWTKGGEEELELGGKLTWRSLICLPLRFFASSPTA